MEEGSSSGSEGGTRFPNSGNSLDGSPPQPFPSEPRRAHVRRNSGFSIETNIETPGHQPPGATCLRTPPEVPFVAGGTGKSERGCSDPIAPVGARILLGSSMRLRPCRPSDAPALNGRLQDLRIPRMSRFEVRRGSVSDLVPGSCCLPGSQQSLIPSLRLGRGRAGVTYRERWLAIPRERGSAG